MKSLSFITENFTESVIREMTRICDAVNGYNLAQGFPDFGSPPEIKKAAVGAIEKDKNQYPVTFGEFELREAISKKVKCYNGIDCNPETEITVTCGATEAMIATLIAIINPREEIIVFEPFYENYGPDGILAGATPHYIPLNVKDWSIPKKLLRQAFNKNTKAIIINTPNNPTGKVFSQEELSEIAKLCVKWDVYAITDEIYEHILYDGKRHHSLATFTGMKERTITINSISKTYAVTGWRVGWAIASKLITQRIRKVHDFLTVGAPNPFQHAAATALGFNHAYYQKLQHRYQSARDLLFDILKETGFVPYLPKGAYYIMTEVTELMKKLQVANDVDFSRRLIELTGVATVPGSSFFSQPEKGKSLVRFCFCKKEETLMEVERRLKKLTSVC